MTDYPDYVVWFRGHPACPCQVKWLPVFEAEAQRRGILTGPLPLSQLIGGAPQSGGTHTDGGADDTYPLTGIRVDAYVWLSRQMGADATWERPYNWDGRNGVAHVHRVLTGCPHNAPARYQIDAVRRGENGLVNHGPDTGPRPLSGRTWREGIQWAHQQAEEHEMTPTQAQQLAQIASDVTALKQAVTAMQDREDRRDINTRKRLQKLIAQGKATKADLEALAADLDASRG